MIRREIAQKNFDEEKEILNQIDIVKNQINGLTETKEQFQDVTQKVTNFIYNFQNNMKSNFGGNVCYLRYDTERFTGIEFNKYLDNNSRSIFGKNTVLNWLLTLEDYSELEQRNFPPDSVSDQDVYFVSDKPKFEWEGHSRQIAKYDSDTSTWNFIDPLYDFTKRIENCYSIFRMLDSPPSQSIITGSKYLVSDSPEGEWEGYDGQVATWNGSGWQFEIPDDGDLAVSEKFDLGFTYFDMKWNEQDQPIVHICEEFSYSFDHIYKPINIGNGSYGIENKIKINENQKDIYQKDLEKIQEGQKKFSRIIRRGL